MNRKEFLHQIGVGAAFVLTGMCFQQCTRDQLDPYFVDFTLNLDDPENAALLEAGGYIVRQGVVIAQTSYGTYVAATRTCSHDAYQEIFLSYRDEFECGKHGARFDLQGNGLNTFSSNGLRIYQVDVQGNTLRVFS